MQRLDTLSRSSSSSVNAALLLHLALDLLPVAFNLIPIHWLHSSNVSGQDECLRRPPMVPWSPAGFPTLLGVPQFSFVKFLCYECHRRPMDISTSYSLSVRLADFILANVEPILVEWESFARSIWPRGATSRPGRGARRSRGHPPCDGRGHAVRPNRRRAGREI
jgi:hypothetical protein